MDFLDPGKRSDNMPLFSGTWFVINCSQTEFKKKQHGVLCDLAVLGPSLYLSGWMLSLVI